MKDPDGPQGHIRCRSEAAFWNGMGRWAGGGGGSGLWGYTRFEIRSDMCSRQADSVGESVVLRTTDVVEQDRPPIASRTRVRTHKGPTWSLCLSCADTRRLDELHIARDLHVCKARVTSHVCMPSSVSVCLGLGTATVRPPSLSHRSGTAQRQSSIPPGCRGQGYKGQRGART